MPLKNWTPFTKCFTKIYEIRIDDAENLVMSMMYDLLEYSSNYSDTKGSLCFYCNDEATNFDNDYMENIDTFRKNSEKDFRKNQKNETRIISRECKSLGKDGKL